MATQFCQKCKKAHPGRDCDYDDKGECAETADSNEAAAKPSGEATQLGNRNRDDSKQKRPPKLSV